MASMQSGTALTDADAVVADVVGAAAAAQTVEASKKRTLGIRTIERDRLAPQPPTHLRQKIRAVT